MKYNCLLEKIHNDHNRLRTNEIEGQCDRLPTLGEQFTMFGEGLVFGSRMVQTSPIVAVWRNGWCFDVTTESGSEYKISISMKEDGGPHDASAGGA